jgi:hypothetical protein
MRPHMPAPGSGEPIVAGVPRGHQVGSGRHQSVQPVAFGVAWPPKRELSMALAAIPGQSAGIDGVGLSEGSKRANKGFHLSRVGSMGGEASRGCGRQQGGFISANGLAHHQISRLDSRGPVGQGGRLVGERDGSAGAAVKHDDMALANIASDEADKGFGGRFIRAILWELMIACGRLPLGEAAPSTHQALQGSGQTTLMTTGERANRETVHLSAPWSWWPPGPRRPAHAGRPILPQPQQTIARRPDANAAIQRLSTISPRLLDRFAT